MLKELIEKWCKENNTNIARLESMCELGNGTIRKWGITKPNAKSLIKVSEKTGISISELFKCLEEIKED